MINTSFIKNKYNTLEEDKKTFLSSPPFPNISLRDFLPIDYAYTLNKECNFMPLDQWKKFTRKGSHMVEYNNLNHMDQGSQW